MKINIEELSNTPEGQLTLEFNEVINELGNDQPVDGEVTARLIPSGVQVEGHVETDMMLECDRCMVNYPYHVDVNIDEVFIKGNLSSAKEIELTQENFVEELKGRNEIDVTDLIYQSIILSIPSKNLCQEECPGTKEFQELQIEKPADPRLEVFKKLSEQESDEQ
ncbi:MAG: hypothetical protein A2287_08130 [Candidatus Melainabacteria bacterium RIFOXYA12_FULL_32_12]|nr:MAG: hypothetical protein A2255_05400 [Candidatus Melainabacteria bacterium RIFOXYA2_FULL_32_9]OGI27152.1 MAG: hypothetical protein A2287_08130 [Candidatus Melainabacteria bacterium RIFOXYA12_FULL_32_12]